MSVALRNRFYTPPWRLALANTRRWRARGLLLLLLWPPDPAYTPVTARGRPRPSVRYARPNNGVARATRSGGHASLRRVPPGFFFAFFFFGRAQLDFVIFLLFLRSSACSGYVRRRAFLSRPQREKKNSVFSRHQIAAMADRNNWQNK